MRFLFLDFDGVLHPAVPGAFNVAEHFCWLPILQKLLIAHPDVFLVVHSTWRYDHRDHELRVLLGELGERFAGSAPSGPRDQAVISVLEANKHLEIKYLVLDDDGHAFLDSGLNVLNLAPELGLSAPEAQAALRAWLQETA